MYFGCEKLNIVLCLSLKKLVCEYHGVIKALGNNTITSLKLLNLKISDMLELS